MPADPQHREEIRAAIMRYLADRRSVPMSAVAIKADIAADGRTVPDQLLTEELQYLTESDWIKPVKTAGRITPRYKATTKLCDAADSNEL